MVNILTMNMKKNILLMALSAVLAVSCTKELPLYDTPFFSIATQDGASTAVVGSDVENVNTYYVTMSSVSVAITLSLISRSLLVQGLRKALTMRSSPKARR